VIYYSDIDIALTTQIDGDVTKDANNEAVKNSLINILNTMQGSRRMLPTFALNLYGLLFDPIDDITAERIGETMLESLQMWEDRIIIEDIYVIPEYDTNQYKIRMNYKLKNSQEIQHLDYILNKI